MHVRASLAPLLVAAMALGLAALGLAAAGAHAQTFPSKPIRMVVPFTPGGTTDILARTVGQKMTEHWGQPVVIDNRPGAGGNIGSELVAKAPPDGYTLLMGTISTHAINASLYKKLPFDPTRDFAPVSRVGTLPNILIVHPSVPVKSVRELIELAKSKPGELNFASSGVGTSLHLSGELFNSMAGVKLVHIPYKGSSPALADLLGGQVKIMFDNLPSALPHVKAGKLKPLAVTSTKRAAVLPEVPTVIESGLPGFEVTSWFAVFAPAKTPKDIVTKLNGEIVKILNSGDVKEKLTQIGVDAAPTTPEELAAFAKAETEKWGKVVKATGASAD
jgi:tripartite-type tricarboxylate transporter receptor subunit TctC